MYSLPRRYLWTAVGFLIAGLLLGAYLLVRRELGGGWPDPYPVSVHTHLILVGFVMFMILGVGLWIFPRPRRDDTRYRPELAEATYWILTVATVARAVGELVRAWSTERWLAWIVLAGGLGQVVGLLLYFWNMRSRIRPVGSAAREARGERF